MDPHEAPEASPPDEPDLQEIVSRWAGESRQLLLALPVLLAKLDELKEEREALRNRLMDLEQENLTLRESRENLAEIFAKLKDLISAPALEEVQRHLGLELVVRAPHADAGAPAVNVEPAPAPPKAAVPDVTPVQPDPPVRDVTPTPSSPRDVTPMPPSRLPVPDAAPEPPPPKSEPQPEPVAAGAPAPPPAPAPEPAPPVTAEPPPPAAAEPVAPNPEPKPDKTPLRRVDPSPVRLASVFRPPGKKERQSPS
ncbi:MAG TPA: hypothetical protein VID04_11010 [Methylomirabilota bacterium]|jgi:hypothetical protein